MGKFRETEKEETVMVAPPRTRKIAGETYMFRDGSRSKGLAEKAAKRLRENGHYKSVRVVENVGSILKWGVYVTRWKR